MWYEKQGNNTDVVLSSKVVISRNIKGFPFPVMMSVADKENVLGMIRQASGKLDMNFIRCDELSEDAKEDMFKNYYAEAKFLNEAEGAGFLIGKEEGTAVVVNNRNHIEIESIMSGSDVYSCYKKADKIATTLESEMEIAFSERLGFLTSDISNVGMGVQIINTFAIPAIEKTVGAIQVLGKRLESYDWQIIPVGNVKGTGLYITVNSVMLGIDEEELLKRASLVLKDVISLERSCRKNICKRKPGIVEDQFCRSYALLKYARRMEIPEALEHINWLRVGRDNIRQNDVEVDWNSINKMTHIVRRNYKEAISKNGRSPMFSQARCEGIRSILGKETK